MFGSGPRFVSEPSTPTAYPHHANVQERRTRPLDPHLAPGRVYGLILGSGSTHTPCQGGGNPLHLAVGALPHDARTHPGSQSRNQATRNVLPWWKLADRVSDMETGESRSLPSPEEARRMVDAANREEEATKNPPLPGWFFVAQASAFAIALMAQVLAQPWSVVLTGVGIASVVTLGVRYVFYRPGYGAVGLDAPGAFPFVLTVLIAVGVPVLLAISLEQRWWWLVAGALAGILTLEMGRRYRRVGSRD